MLLIRIREIGGEKKKKRKPLSRFLLSFFVPPIPSVFFLIYLWQRTEKVEPACEAATFRIRDIRGDIQFQYGTRDRGAKSGTVPAIPGQLNWHL